jgi:hypothetical protein
VPYLPEGWKAECDDSINNGSGGHKCEIVSPVLRGPEGLAQVVEVLRTLEAKGQRGNVSCGVHVHVGWKRDWPSEALARLVTIVAYVEKGPERGLNVIHDWWAGRWSCLRPASSHLQDESLAADGLWIGQSLAYGPVLTASGGFSGRNWPSIGWGSGDGSQAPARWSSPRTAPACFQSEELSQVAPR